MNYVFISCSVGDGRGRPWGPGQPAPGQLSQVTYAVCLGGSSRSLLTLEYLAITFISILLTTHEVFSPKLLIVLFDVTASKLDAK